MSLTARLLVLDKLGVAFCIQVAEVAEGPGPGLQAHLGGFSSKS